jgi:hypothetical protein
MTVPSGFRNKVKKAFAEATAAGELVHCPSCGDPMEPLGTTKKRSATRDHILPRTRRYTYPDGTIMHKVVCAHCNNLRAACGHCWGAVACIRAVAKIGKFESRKNETYLAKRWQMTAVSLTTEPPSPAPGPPPRTGQPYQSMKPRPGFATLADVWPKRA